MQSVKAADVGEFLRYVDKIPEPYSGTAWKIGDVFATWMFKETPKERS